MTTKLTTMILKLYPENISLKQSHCAAAASVNWDQVLGGGCNCGDADMRKYHNFSEGFKSVDMLAKSGYFLP